MESESARSPAIRSSASARFQGCIGSPRFARSGPWPPPAGAGPRYNMGRGGNRTLASQALELELSPLERFLRMFTDVRPGEGSTAVLMLANAFLILCSYYFVKPLREGWIAISGVEGLGQWEVKAYSSFGQSLLLIPILAWYGRLTHRLPRAELITWSSLFCISNMVVFWGLQPGVFFEHLPVSGILFYLWVGIFGVFVVAQFFAFAADVYDDGPGRRILPVIAIGATAGAASGAWITSRLVESGLVAKEYLLLVATLPLGMSILLTRILDHPASPVGTTPPAAPVGPTGRTASSAIELVLTNRFLVAVAGITLLVNWVNTNGENLLFRVLQADVGREMVAQGLASDSRAAQEFTKT